MCGKPYALAKMNMISTIHRTTKNQNVLPRTEQHASRNLFQLFRWGVLSSSTSMLGSGRAVLGFVAIAFTVAYKCRGKKKVKEIRYGEKKNKIFVSKS